MGGEQQLSRSWVASKSFGLPHFWLAGAGAGGKQARAAGQGQDWQELTARTGRIAARGGPSHFHTGRPPHNATTIRPSEHSDWLSVVHRWLGSWQVRAYGDGQNSSASINSC